ncbi:MAG: hypothetical protein FWD61_12045 [Phycisphaerales bacterium]|nr:hypothetical protein [Phycisphaerales bacterium]
MKNIALQLDPKNNPRELYGSLIKSMTPERRLALYRICNEVILENHDFFLERSEREAMQPKLRLVRDDDPSEEDSEAEELAGANLSFDEWSDIYSPKRGA